MSRRSCAMLSAVLPVLLACGCIQVGPMLPARLKAVVVEESPRWLEPNRIAIIDFSGFLSTGERGLLSWGGTSLADVKEKLDLAAEDRRVKAIILRINSPGGEAAASDMMYQELLRFKEESGKPVVAHFMSVAASGGYFVAMGADHIVATPTAVTGSVGVIMHFINVEGLYGKIGLRSEVIKSGALKDIGSPTRTLTAEEREILGGINRSMFDLFVDAVRAGRSRSGMAEQDLAVLTDGRVLTARQALELHMVDQLGYLDDTITEARALAGIEYADVILYRAYPSQNANIYARAAENPALLDQALKVLLRRQGPMFLYLWSPGL